MSTASPDPQIRRSMIFTATIAVFGRVIAAFLVAAT
jgi:hypothetical protein